MLVNCLNCKKDFPIPPSRKDSAKFCSNQCKNIFNNKTVYCKTCGKELLIKKSSEQIYCSNECSGKDNRNREVRICKFCGKEFSIKKSSKKFLCSMNCKHEFSKSEMYSLSKKHKVTCQFCGKTFPAKNSTVKRGFGKYCSQLCARKGQKHLAKKNYCRICNKEIKNRNKFCSDVCRKVGTKKIIKCNNCGKEIYVYRSRKLVKFCSPECNYKFKRKSEKFKILKKCESCGKDFFVYPSNIHVKFCSPTCYTNTKRNREFRICEYCGDMFEVKKSIKSKCCSYECRQLRLRKIFDEASHKGNLNKWFYKTHKWMLVRDYILERDGFECQMCYENNDLRVHHIKSKRNGGDESYTNLITLCVSCHSKVHKKDFWFENIHLFKH